jgi:hypothetical protein
LFLIFKLLHVWFSFLFIIDCPYPQIHPERIS